MHAPDSKKKLEQIMRSTVAGTSNPMQQFSGKAKYNDFKNFTLLEEENEETDAYSEDQDQVEKTFVASRT